MKSRYDEIADIATYAHDLPEEEKEWLNRFVAEYVCADFNHGGEHINVTPEDRSICWAKNNHRNQCLYTKEKSYGTIEYIDDMSDKDPNMEDKKDYILKLDDADFDKKADKSKDTTDDEESTLSE